MGNELKIVPAFQESRISRRGLLVAAATTAAASGLAKCRWMVAAEVTAAKVVVGAHPWVYAATQWTASN
ncbi:MAG: hypothetical protein ABSG53_29230 [Thermoguttaceae bacterium]